MTIGFAAITLGAIMVATGLQNMTVADILSGKRSGDRSNLLGNDVTDAGFVHATGTAVGDVGKTATGVLDSGKHPSGVGTIDGKEVAKWIIPYVKKARSMGWNGTVLSGYRSPEYSEQLCMNMCGAPSCPGTCAGKSSNHSGKVYPAGAIDVSDEATFGSIMAKIHAPLKNDLPSDRVHFSYTGH